MVWSHLLVSGQRLLYHAHGYPHLVLDAAQHLVTRLLLQEGRHLVAEALANLEHCGADTGHRRWRLCPAVRLWLLERGVRSLCHFGDRFIRMESRRRRCSKQAHTMNPAQTDIFVVSAVGRGAVGVEPPTAIPWHGTIRWGNAGYKSGPLTFCVSLPVCKSTLLLRSLSSP